MTDHVRTLAEISRFPVACIPNAGPPDEDGRYNQTPEMLAAKLAEFADNGWVNVVGGCCGTVPDHIASHRRTRARQAAADAPCARRTVVSGIEAYEISDEKRPVIVGERTNVLGSRKFKRLIAEGKIEEAAEVGRAQVRKGAAILDVCLQDPDRDELSDVKAFLDIVTKKVKVPIMIDSTDAERSSRSRSAPAGQVGHQLDQPRGRRGEVRARHAARRRFGAALVVGCIDDDKQQAQAITRARKLEVASAATSCSTEKYGIAPEDIIFDPLVFPVGTGDQNYSGSASSRSKASA
jgi:5-methyltetrahydrofolate--homocysteine methyltransferase